MNQKKVSIIIPVYNGSEYINQAIESALNQTYSNTEVLVINDGSDDNGKTKKCIEPYLDRIKYIEKQNGGVGSAINEGIRQMSGEYFVWLSHDDLLEKSKIERQIHAIKESGDFMTISATNCVFFEDRTKMKLSTRYQDYFSPNRIKSSVFLLLWGELHFSTLLFHRNHFDRIGIFNESLITAQDNDFIFRLLRGRELNFIDAECSYVRIHENSGTNCKKKKLNEENCNLYQRILQSLSEEELKEISGKAKYTRDKINGIITSMGPNYSQIMKKDTPIKPSNMVLVGAGGYGRRLNYELIENGVKPICFLDNDPLKDGCRIDGTICKKLCKENIPQEAELVITNKFYLPLGLQLRELGIRDYKTKMEIDRRILLDEMK